MGGLGVGHAIIIIGMLVTGSINTISTKLADMQCVVDYRLNTTLPQDCSGPIPMGGACPSGCTQFDHPFVQAAGMFIGELLCIFAFKASMLFAFSKDNSRGGGESFNTSDHDESSDVTELIDGFPPHIFALPALCDMFATSMMYLGLTMTYASVFQMLRGSVVVFTGILSIMMLNRKLWPCHWLGMLLVMGGAFVVGVSSVVGSGSAGSGESAAPSNPLMGNMLIVGAQFVVAMQMVIEEKFLSKYRVGALEAVGWEGFWGLIFLSIALCGMYFSPMGPDVCDGHPCIENAVMAVRQISTSRMLEMAVLDNILSIAFFNYFGISVTQSMSATHRMVLDSIRTMVIWVFSLAVGWQSFAALQVVGFTILLFGTLVYNELLVVPGFSTGAEHGGLIEALVDEEETDRLLPENRGIN